MKNLTTNIFIFFSLLVFASCSTSQTEIKWNTLTYMYESGPLPPKYQYSYNITLNTNCDGAVVYSLAGEPSNSPLTYEFKFSKDSLAVLNEAVVKSKILDEDIDRLPEGKHPVGGHLEKVRVVMVNPNPNLDQPPRAKESPYFPSEKYQEGLQNLYKTIVAFVPQKIWDDIEVKKEESQKNRE